MNTVIVTYSTQFAIVRFYAGSDDDRALTLAEQTLRAGGYTLGVAYQNIIGVNNSGRVFHVWTRTPAGDPLVPAVDPDITWVDVDA